MSTKLHQSAHEQPQKRITWIRPAIGPTIGRPGIAQKRFIEEHGFAEFGKWHRKGTEIMPSAWIQQKEESAASDALPRGRN